MGNKQYASGTQVSVVPCLLSIVYCLLIKNWLNFCFILQTCIL